MRLENHVVEREQGYWRARLVLEYIKSSAPKSLGYERVDHFLFIDHRATRNIDDYTLRTKRIEHRAIGQMSCGCPPGHGDDEKVRLPRKLHGISYERPEHGRVLCPAAIDDLQSTGLGAPRDCRSDTSEPQDSRCLAAHRAREW